MKYFLILGLSLAMLLAMTPIAAHAQSVSIYTYLTKWGSFGSGNGQFNSPYDVTVDSSGNVYVSDENNQRIQKFTSTGTFITKFGALGIGNGQFKTPFGIDVDSSGNVYVVDYGNFRIQKFSSSGTFLTKWGSGGSGNGQFSYPQGISVDPSGNVYVADTGNHRIQKFSSSGTFLTKWGSIGTANGQFQIPVAVATDNLGNVYVVDHNNYRIQKFNSNGVFLTKWGSFGGGNGQFNGIAGIAVDSFNNVYVSDFNNRVQKFTSTGTFITKFGTTGAGNGQLSHPIGLDVNSAGNVYVVDSTNVRIEVFAPSSYGITHMSDTTVSSPSLVSAPRQLVAEYATSTSQLVGDKIDQITLKLQKVGAPTGTAQIGVFNSDLSVKKLFATKDVSTISTTATDYTFKLPTTDPLYTIASGDRIGIKFTGGSSSAGINVTPDRDAADPFDGTNSYRVRYESAWISSTSEDMYMILRQTHG